MREELANQNHQNTREKQPNQGGLRHSHSVNGEGGREERSKRGALELENGEKALRLLLVGESEEASQNESKER